MTDAEELMAKWLVGERLSCVLHLTDSALAYRLSRQGHEVVVAGDDVVGVRDRELHYVRTGGSRLPFAADSFDAVVVPDLRAAPTALAEYARVLRPGGVVSTLERTHDETIPWFRRLLDLVGEAEAAPPGADTFRASGLFHEPETRAFAAWEQLDLAGLLQFVRRTRPHVDESTLARVGELFGTVASGTGTLRLRHRTLAVRATVLKPEPEPVTPTDTVLLELR